MKIIIETPILIHMVDPKDSLDLADWLDDQGIDFEHSFMYSLVIIPQSLCTTTEFREELFDRLKTLGIDTLLERVGHNVYKAV